jgi:hypothetical protein
MEKLQSAKGTGYKPKDKDKDKGKSKWKGRDRQGKSPKPAWMTKPPGKGQKATKVVEKKEYHWCMKHKAWTRHKPSECRLEAPIEQVAQPREEQKQESGGKALSLTKALATIAELTESL